jgi:hypothetical protein
MILHSLLQHARETNWFLVIVELLVVVVGLWGAFQLDNWKQQRQDAASERFYLNQLHAELLAAIPETQRRLDNSREVVDLVAGAVLLLQRPDGRAGLDPEQCRSLFRVSILSGTPATLTTLQELIHGGTLALVRDRELKTMLYRFHAREDSNRAYIAMMQRQQTMLTDEFPMLMPRFLENSESYTGTVTCDTDGIRNSRAFLNRLIANRGRYSGLLGVFSGDAELLADLDARLDQLLNLSH